VLPVESKLGNDSLYILRKSLIAGIMLGSQRCHTNKTLGAGLKSHYRTFRVAVIASSITAMRTQTTGTSFVLCNGEDSFVTTGTLVRQGSNGIDLTGGGGAVAVFVSSR
jgi:hypothetical protein